MSEYITSLLSVDWRHRWHFFLQKKQCAKRPMLPAAGSSRVIIYQRTQASLSLVAVAVDPSSNQDIHVDKGFSKNDLMSMAFTCLLGEHRLGLLLHISIISIHLHAGSITHMFFFHVLFFTQRQVKINRLVFVVIRMPD